MVSSLGLGCANDPAQQPVARQDRIAKAYCDCTSRLVALNQEANGLSRDSAAQSNFSQMLQQIQGEYNKAKECAATIVGQYGKLKADELEAVEKALAVQCAASAGQHDLLRELLGE